MRRESILKAAVGREQHLKGRFPVNRRQAFAARKQTLLSGDLVTRLLRI